MSAAQTISPKSLKQLHELNPDLAIIDVRTPAEFESMRAPFATLAPLDSLDPKRVAEEAGSKTVYIFCLGGARAEMARAKFLAQGLDNVCVVEGGVRAWAEAGLPVVRGQKAISLERQVRIAAGGLVVLGVGLGLGVHPGFFGLAAFVGAGLVFAGITDTCGMGMLLARMPWNQTSGDAKRTCST